MNNNRDVQFHDQLRVLSGAVYKNNGMQVPKNYLKIGHKSNPRNGFYAEAYAHGKDIIVVYRGTDTDKGKLEKGKDYFNDWLMTISVAPWQKSDAISFYNKMKKDFPNSNITATGHSLGGSLAQLVGAQTGCSAVTFGAYGTRSLLGKDFRYSDNIINYGDANDPVFTTKINDQIGKTYVLDGKNPNNQDSERIAAAQKFGRNPDTSLYYHYLDNYDNLANAREYRPELYETRALPADTFNRSVLESQPSAPLSAVISYDIDERSTVPESVLADGYSDRAPGSYQAQDKIFTDAEIADMSQEEFNRNSADIMAAARQGRVIKSRKGGSSESKCPDNASWRSGSGGLSGSEGGRWVTINGNHVYIED